MRANGEAMHLVAQFLDMEQRGRIDRQHPLAPVHQVKHLAPLASMMRSLGHPDQADVLDPQFLQHPARRVQLSAPAIDQHQIGPDPLVAIRVLLLRASKAALEHLAHHREIIVGRRAPDVELAILALAEPFRPRDDHRADRAGPLNMGVVVNLDPVGRFGQTEQVGDVAQILRLRRRFGHPPVERLDRVALCLFHQPPPRPALRLRNFDAKPRPLAQRIGQQLAFGQRPVDQHILGRRHLFVKLHQELRQHLRLGHFGGMRGKKGAMAPILAAADEERLDADLSLFGRQREDIGIADPFGIDRLRPLDEGQRLQPVAQHRRLFEVEIGRRRLHRLAQLRLHPGRFAHQEIARIADQLGIARLVDAIDARRRTTADLIEQTGPVAAVVKPVGARSQQEQLLQRIQRLAHLPRARERPEIIALHPPRAAMQLHPRKIMIAAQQDVGKALIVAQQDVVGGPEPLDQLRLQQQRLGLVIGRHHRHAARLRDHPPQPVRQLGGLGIVGDAVLQRPRLADIQHVAARILHPVDAGPRGQRFQHIADRRDPGVQIGRLRPAHGKGRTFLIETIGGIGIGHRRADVGGSPRTFHPVARSIASPAAVIAAPTTPRPTRPPRRHRSR